jgi:uncharacterized membrane protein YhaH (DUF805 family)
MKRLFLVPLLFSATNLLAQRHSPTPYNAAADSAAASAVGAGCCGSFLFLIFAIVAIFVLNIALLVWVARDAKSRGMDNSVMWMILVFFTSLLGLIIYIFSRPQGELVPCPTCNNKRLKVSAKCPHCGNP